MSYSVIVRLTHCTCTCKRDTASGTPYNDHDFSIDVARCTVFSFPTVRLFHVARKTGIAVYQVSTGSCSRSINPALVKYPHNLDILKYDLIGWVDSQSKQKQDYRGRREIASIAMFVPCYKKKKKKTFVHV